MIAMLSTTAASVYKSAADAFAKQNKELYPNVSGVFESIDSVECVAPL